jgi:hypothetical protein
MDDGYFFMSVKNPIKVGRKFREGATEYEIKSCVQQKDGRYWVGYEAIALHYATLDERPKFEWIE